MNPLLALLSRILPSISVEDERALTRAMSLDDDDIHKVSIGKKG